MGDRRAETKRPAVGAVEASCESWEIGGLNQRDLEQGSGSELPVGRCKLQAVEERTAEPKRPGGSSGSKFRAGSCKLRVKTVG